MKKQLALAALLALIAVIAIACNTPQPLPVAPTPIPTLVPATLPPSGSPTPRSEVANVVFPASPPSAKDGEAVYQANCATCHGSDGNGAVEGARDFNDQDYMRAAAPVDFYQSITNGKGNMPSFKDKLSDEDRWNATYYLWSFSVKQAQLDKGKQVFEANCVACHGVDGKGSIPQAPHLNDVEFISSYPPDYFYKSVSGGKGIMPAWQDRLSSDDRWAAVEYARSFAYQPIGSTAQPAAPAPPATAVPVPTKAPTATEAPTATQAPAFTAAPQGNPTTGEQIWAQKPCSGCHGANAEGAIGPKLAGTALSWDQVLQVVRNGKGGGRMPAFDQSVVTDQEMADIYAWLKSQ
jgi:mono/diheme cytochrome c family protein